MAPEPSSIAEVARELRRRIFAGEYPVGEQMLSREQIVKEFGMGSAESAGVALRILRDDGLVSLEPGRGTFVLPRQPYEVEVTPRYAGDDQYTDVTGAKLAAAVREAAAAEPAVRGEAQATPGFRRVIVALTVEASDQASAVACALAVIRKPAAGLWDLSKAPVTVKAAPERATRRRPRGNPGLSSG